MKHNNFLTGLMSSRFSNFLSLCFLTLTLTISGNVWGVSTTQKFTQGSTIYCDVSASGWTDSRTKIGVFFYNQSNTDQCYEKGNSTNYNNMSGSFNVGSGYEIATRVAGENHIYKVTVPNADLGMVCFLRVSWNDGNWTWAQTVKMSVDDMGSNNCVHLNDKNDNSRNNCSWTTYSETPCDHPQSGDWMWLLGNTDLTGKDWGDQNTKLKWDCDLGVYYWSYTNLQQNTNMKYRFKINKGNWSWQLNSDNIDNNHSGANLALKSDNEDKRITFDLAQNSDVTIYTDGSKVWAAIPTPAPVQTNWSFRGDMWLDGGGGWLAGSDAKAPHFMDNGDGTATCSFVFPNAQCRLTLCENGSDKTSDRCDGTTALTKSKFESSKYYFNATGDVKKYTFTLTTSTGHFTAKAENYTVKKTGWHVFMSAGDGDPTEVGTITEETGLVISNVASGAHNMYITDGSSTTQAGVNWFGGLYIDKGNSDVSWATQRVYYDSGKFSSTQFPIRGDKDATGRFKLDAASDIVIAFDGGKITINKVVTPEPSLQPWSGDSYKEWYLTGDFTKPDGSFDGWTMNPGDYKFVADGDNYQKVSITLDPNDPNNNEKIFHNYNGQKLTRFEIIRKDTWDNPRINKPQFDSESSNCSLQTDWKDGGSNRMSLELTTKSVIEFKIWRLGTSASNAERKVTVTITPIEQVTVTFMANDEIFAQQIIEKGGKATKPATDPTKAGYNFTGWDWNFNTTINENTPIYAKEWELKGVESVTLDKTTLKLLENGTTATLTPTILPNDVLNTTTTWSSDNESVATVVDGEVTPHALGTATITCTVANTAGSESATCTISVVDCELVPTAIFDGVGEIANPFDPSGQTEPENLTKCQIKVGSNENHVAYVDPNDTKVKHGEGSSDYYYWYKIEAGTASYATDGKIYYLKNVANGKYLCMSDEVIGTGNWGSNYTVTTDKTATNEAKCTWFFKQSSGIRLVNLSTKKSDNTGYQTGEMFIHRYQGVSSPAGTYAVTGSSDGDQGNWELTTSFINSSTIPNPNYKTATITKDDVTYYRFAANGTMTCTLTDYALKVGDKISVSCYNTASSTVSGELRIGGTKMADINLNAGASTYEYIVTNDNKGATQIVVATSNADFCVASVKVERELPIGGGKVAGLAWTPTPADPVVATVGEGDITTYTATATSAGDITYSSSNTAVATVNAATGVVTPVAAGNAVITATIEQDGCYAGGSITYNLQVNDLPKPTITFVTVPTEMPQGLANQPIVVTTTGGDNFALAITEGTGATLNITENTGSRITATLSMGAEATNIVLTASTDRTATLAQNAVSANVAVSACIPEGANIFEFTLTGSDAATGQVAGGIIGGTVDQTALGTVGTEDNPAMVDVIKMKYQVDNQSPDRNFAVDLTSNSYIKVQADGNVDAAYWYLIPAGTETYKPSWTNNTYQLYYIYNKATGKYLTHGETLNNSGNNDWKYYTTITTATNAKTDAYKWFFDTSKDGGTRVVNRADAGESLPHSFVLNTCNQHHNICDGVAPKPALICGHTSDANSHTIAFDLSSLTTQDANPAMLKSVEYNNKTYYIISGGSITLHGDFKAGDVVNVDTYNRKTNEDDVEEYQIQADADSYTYTTTTTNAYVCVNNIKVWRNQVGEMVTPTLTWDADLSQPQIVDLNNGGVAPTHVATANVTTVSTITYSSSNTAVATVDGAGQVSIVGTPNHGATTTITATMAAVGCYNEASVSYTIRIKNIDPTTLQTMIEGTSAGGTLVLADDYDGCDATINKAITINAQNHTIGNLTVETTGDLTLESTMNVNNFSIYATAGNTETPATSGQVRSADKLNVNGNAYFYYTVDPSGQVQYGWYDFTVPFPVDVRTGIKGIRSSVLKESFANGVDYAIMEYLGEKRAQGQYSYQKFSGVMQPNQLYSITLDNEYNYNTLRFQKTAGGALVASENVELKAFSGAETNANWNGVGNGTLRHADANVTSIYLQVYQSGNKSFLTVNKNDYSFVIGSAFMVQETGTMTLSLASHGALLTPNRQAEAMKPITIQIAREGQVFTDQLFISASEDGGQQYTMGVDLAKAGDLGYATVPQLWVNAYDHPLCAYDAQMIDGQAHYLLSLYAPAAGEYTLNTKNIPEGITLYLVQNGNILWDLSQTYTLELAKGITNDYGLLLVEEHKVTTGNDNLMNDNNADKILRNGILYILHNGKTFNAQGACISK